MPISETPEAVGLDPERWNHVLQLAESWCRDDRIPALGMIAGRADRATAVHLYGRQGPAADAEPICNDAIFLIASITKPIVATGVLLLIERGQLALGDRVCDHIPEFRGLGRYGITVRHLLTHTSGLPDMLPNNRELRIAHAPFSAFVEGTCKVEPDFPAGRDVRYQSMGFALLGEIISRLSGQPYAEFLKNELFDPLGMHDTALGAPAEWYAGENPKADRMTEIRAPNEQADAGDWGWNSRYWRSLGAPWGGLLTTPADLARFAQMLLSGGRCGNAQIVSRASIRTATCNQLQAMVDVPDRERRCRPWGLGWRLNWPAHSTNFGDLLGPNTYGHWGATGTVMWIDPDRQTFAVILTTEPQEPLGFYLARLSNAVAAAWAD